MALKIVLRDKLFRLKPFCFAIMNLVKNKMFFQYKQRSIRQLLYSAVFFCA